jgi:hypothetical protein
VHDRVPPTQRGTVAVRVEQVGDHRLGAGGLDALGGFLAAGYGADVVALSGQPRQHPAANPAGCTGDKQLHGPLLPVTQGLPAVCSSVGRAAAARKDALIQGLPVPGWQVGAQA